MGRWKDGTDPRREEGQSSAKFSMPKLVLAPSKKKTSSTSRYTKGIECQQSCILVISTAGTVYLRNTLASSPFMLRILVMQRDIVSFLSYYINLPRTSKKNPRYLQKTRYPPSLVSCNYITVHLNNLLRQLRVIFMVFLQMW